MISGSSALCRVVMIFLIACLMNAKTDLKVACVKKTGQLHQEWEINAEIVAGNGQRISFNRTPNLTEDECRNMSKVENYLVKKIIGDQTKCLEITATYHYNNIPTSGLTGKTSWETVLHESDCKLCPNEGLTWLNNKHWKVTIYCPSRQLLV